MSISISIKSLCKNYNGFFISEKQKSFLSKTIKENDGIFSFCNYGKYTTEIFFDDFGIVKVVNIGSKTKNKKTIFERVGKPFLNKDFEKALLAYKECKDQLDKLNNFWESTKSAYGHEDSFIDMINHKAEKDKLEIFNYTKTLFINN